MRLRRSTEETEDASTIQRTDSESESWFGRAKAKYGLGALLVGLGAVLFVIPEPITSTAGIALMAIGAVVWLVSWIR